MLWHIKQHNNLFTKEWKMKTKIYKIYKIEKKDFYFLKLKLKLNNRSKN
jgi:hypothetical protein